MSVTTASGFLACGSAAGLKSSGGKDLALVVNIDGFGNPPNKISKYNLFAKRRPPWFNGFKLFYHEDMNMMSPRAVLRLHPRPDVIIYE